MATIVLIIGPAWGDESEVDGQYLSAFDPDGDGGRGTVIATRDPTKALQFKTAGEALECWRRQSTVLPLRPDGKPNRPLTAFTVEFVKWEA